MSDMSKPLDGTRVRAVRELRGLTQEKLAKVAKISKESIYRIEKGEQPGTRQTTRVALAKALNVEPDVLTGDLPVPAAEPASAPDDLVFEMFPLSHKVDGAVRNAFTLTARRYGIPMARIIELAPALFVLVAEGSLRRRQDKLAKLREAFDEAEELRSDFPHLPYEIIPTFWADQAFAAEKDSIARRDILAATLPERIFGHDGVETDYDEHDQNPFVTSLKAEAESLGGDVIIERFSRYDTTFHVCGGDALEIAGGDEDLADCIVQGRIVLAKMPREFWSADAIEARIAWLRGEQQAFNAAATPTPEDMVTMEALLGIDEPAPEGVPP
jgi:transcriptional regulator with XRE-family HTH domain